ncbi:MAG: hypothetical protein FJZ97_14575 [Chloroflexi bacterium]|nr:hypothetical protein [Chloroflexota bacterium]
MIHCSYRDTIHCTPTRASGSLREAAVALEDLRRGLRPARGADGVLIVEDQLGCIAFGRGSELAGGVRRRREAAQAGAQAGQEDVGLGAEAVDREVAATEQTMLGGQRHATGEEKWPGEFGQPDR